MSSDAAHHSRWKTGDAVFGIPLLLGLGMQWLLPLPWRWHPAQLILGALFLVNGMVFIALARRELAKNGQPTDPGFPTERLVTTGVFSSSRNPLYLAAASILAGAGLAFSNLWLLGLVIPAVVVCHYALILPEERYLAAKFEAEYRRYRASVRRWLGRHRSGGHTEEKP